MSSALPIVSALMPVMSERKNTGTAVPPLSRCPCTEKLR